MATIRSRKTAKGSRRWFVEIRRQGVAVRRTFARKAAAERFAREVEADLDRRRELPRLEAERHKLTEAIERYLEDHLSELSSASSRSIRKAQLLWWSQRLGHRVLADITTAAIVDARRELLRRMSGATANRYHAALSRVLHLASTEWGWMETNPARKVSRRKEPRGRVRFLSDSEREALLKAARKAKDRRLYPLVVFAIATGARQGELLQLRWSDVDLVNLKATLHETKNRDRRVLHFPGKAGELLRELAKVESITGFVFAGPLGGRPQFPKTAWKAAVDAAKLEDFRFHDLRHTAASYLAMSGATLPELAAFLGHRTLEMVKRYSHLTAQHQEKVAARMAERFLE